MSRADRNQQEIQQNLFFFEALRAQTLGLTSEAFFPVDAVTLVPTGLYYACLRKLGIYLQTPKSDKPLAADVQKEFLHAFENPKILLRADPVERKIFVLSNFENIEECHCVDTLSRKIDSPDVRKLFTSIILMQTQLLTHCGIPVRIAILGAGRLLQAVSLMATLSRGGVKNFSLDLIDRSYSRHLFLEQCKALLDDFLKLISGVLGFNVLESFCPATTDCVAQLNDIVRDFSISHSSAKVIKSSANVRINFFGELSDYVCEIKDGYLSPTIIGEIDFVVDNNSDQDAAIRDLRSNLPVGTFWTRANKRHESSVFRKTPHSVTVGVDLVAGVIRHDGMQITTKHFFALN